jgi:hypothetical protein
MDEFKSYEMKERMNKQINEWKWMDKLMNELWTEKWWVKIEINRLNKNLHYMYIIFILQKRCKKPNQIFESYILKQTWCLSVCLSCRAGAGQGG